LASRIYDIENCSRKEFYTMVIKSIEDIKFRRVWSGRVARIISQFVC